MNRTVFQVVLSVLFALLLTSLAAAQDRPNVILIMADDVGYECFGSYGSSQYSTPVLDKMADSGIRFNQTYSTPLCTPSRATIMTGKSNVRNYVDFGVLKPGEYSFADLFHEAGYATAIAGKWQLQGSKKAKGTPAGQGFDTYCLWNTGNTTRERYWNPSLEQDGKVLPSAAGDFGPDVASQFLIDFIDKNKDRPFFVYYPMILVHSPFVPTPDSADRDSKDKQKNFEDMVAYADKIVGRILGAVERNGLSEKTVVIFTGDNGTHSDINSALDGRTIRGDKGAATDPGTHVPLFAVGPGIVPGGRVVDDLVDFTDFLPTFADILGVDLKQKTYTDGFSLWPLLRGEGPTQREWSYLYYFPRPYSENFDHPYRHPEIRFVRNQRFKLYGDGRFYDMRKKPGEESRIAPQDGPETAAAWGELSRALRSMPSHGAQIRPEDVRRSRGVPTPHN